jgi:aspartyl-tRNA(Asn)/glutamyl-tRNA(Gln) amidotransferase subunit C
MALTREDVQHIAALCRIGMTDEDLDVMPEQLSHVLEMFRTLQELDTENVPPTGHSVSVEMVMRADESHDSFSPENVLANAPQRDGGLFRVRVVLEE